MTVCIAALMNWYYGPNDIGKAVLTASDRQITAGDIEYEPPQLKISFMTRNVMILIAGDYTVASEALLRTSRYLVTQPENDVGIIAELYAENVRAIKAKMAENAYLVPLGLTSTIFSQNSVPPDLLNSLASQMQNHPGPDAEALIVGTDGQAVHIYLMDSNCDVRLHNDVGFASIGIGAWHAKSQLMQLRYCNTFQYMSAIAAVYSAKKRAEIAPGVGPSTDMYIATRMGVTPVFPELMGRIEELYGEFEASRANLQNEILQKLTESYTEISKKYTPDLTPMKGEEKPDETKKGKK